jgi:putative DNA primase/helicase
MTALAGSFKRIATGVDDFDSDQWMLNVANGIVDLRTGKLREHDRDALCTRAAPTHYDPDAADERWTSFLEHVSNGNAEVVDFLQRAVGYSLTGDTREDKLFFIYGPPARGKSTFVGAVEAAVGEYARTADISTFLASPNAGGGDRPRPDLVRLGGARVVVCKEIDSGARLAEGLVKTITGGDVITVRTLHKAPFEMRPTYKLWLVANDPPVVRGDDAGMWRRMVRVPFERGFDKPDVTFRTALRDDDKLRSAVLAWAVAGVAKWLEHGLEAPAAITASTAEYRAEMDPLGEFLDIFVVFEEDARVSRKSLRGRYEEWCKEEGHSAVGARRLAAAIRERVRGAGLDDHDMSCSVRDGEVVLNGWRGVRLATNLEQETKRRWGRRVASVATVGTVATYSPGELPNSAPRAVSSVQVLNKLSAKKLPLLTTVLQYLQRR